MRSPVSALVIAGVLAASVGPLAVADDAGPRPRLAKTGKLLLDESFSKAQLPANWQPGGRPNAFSIVEDALQGVCPADDGHGPSIGVPLEGRNLTVAFSFRHVKPGFFLCLIDGQGAYGGQAHLLRVGLGATQVNVAQDRGSPASKQEQAKQKAEAAKSGGKVAPPTKEQLADPKFYRTEKLAAAPAKLADGKWHRVLIETNANDVLVQVDDLPPLSGKGTVLDVMKSRLVFLVGLAGTMQIDDVRVWENAR